MLAEHHLISLTSESSIDQRLVEMRGYETANTKTHLKSLGFSDKQCLVSALLLPIWNVHGEVAGYQSRPDKPRIADGKAIKYETPKGSRMSLDVHPSVRPLLGDPNIPLFITEGIKKGDSLASRGLCSVALLGVWNWRGTNEAGGKVALPDWESVALKGREVHIVFDSDVMTKATVHIALARLKGFLETRGSRVGLIYLPASSDGGKQGVDDFLGAGASVEELMTLVGSELLDLLESEPNERDMDPDGESMATTLVRLASSCHLFHDEKDNGYAAFDVDGHKETWPIRSDGFKRWLMGCFYKEIGRAAKSASFSDALIVIEGTAQYDCPLRQVWTRTAQGEDGCIYLDLGDKNWRAVRVASDGWTVMDGCPVHFIRGSTTAALPLPQRGGSLDDLQRVINLPDDDDFKRVVGWLLGSMRPRGPYPVLAFVAEQGSGKSAAARFIRSVVDPSTIPLRGSIRDERDLVIAARSSQIVAFDNVAHLPQWLSDSFCRLASGGGFSTRRLYTDHEEEVFTQTRPLLITGIDDYIANGDLLDRTMLVNLPTIPPSQRRQEAKLEELYEEMQPLALGALLSAACAALRNVESVEFSILPRMADFAAWVVAAEDELGWPAGSFLNAYMAGATEAQDVVLEASPIGEPVRELVEDLGRWEGTAKDLLADLSARVTEDTRRSKTWPKTARAISGSLRRLAPSLRSIGIEVEFHRENNSSRKRVIGLRLETGDSIVRTVQPSGSELDEMDVLDGKDGSQRTFDLDSARLAEPATEVIERRI